MQGQVRALRAAPTHSKDCRYAWEHHARSICGGNWRFHRRVAVRSSVNGRDGAQKYTGAVCKAVEAFGDFMHSRGNARAAAHAPAKNGVSLDKR